MVIKKNRRENGRRWSELVSKPHSKGEDFSRLSLFFFLKTSERVKTTSLTKKITGEKIMSWKIIFPFQKDFLIGSQVY